MMNQYMTNVNPMMGGGMGGMGGGMGGMGMNQYGTNMMGGGFGMN